MNSRLIHSLVLAALLPGLADAAGLPPWEFGMSKSQVVSFKEFGPYKSFSNGDLETYSRPFHGRKANVQFFFKGDRVRRIGVFLYEGTDPKGGIPAWRSAYEALQQDYGKISMPDAHIAANSGPVNPDVLAIGAAMNAEVTGETKMAPAKQPSEMHVFARFFSAIVQKKKWYYVTVVYDPSALSHN